MVTIKINKNKYKIPESWRDLSFGKFCLFTENNEFIKYLPEAQQVNAFIKILTNVPDADILKMELKLKNKIILTLSKALTQKLVETKNSIFKLENKYYFFDHNDANISYGQYIDYISLTKNISNPFEISHKTAAILIKEIKIKNKFKFFFKRLVGKSITKKEFVIQKYQSESVEKLSELLYEKLPIQYFLRSNNFWTELNKKIRNIYEGMFQEIRTIDDEGNKVISSSSAIQDFTSKWNFYITLFDLAGQDITRMDEIAELNYWTVMNHISFLNEKQNIENKKIK